MRRKLIWIGVPVLIVVAVGAVAKWNGRPKPTPVQAATVGREDLQAKVSANGKVQAQRKVDISATIPGQIVRLAVKEGDQVKKGQFLLQIDPVSPRATAQSTEYSMQALVGDLASARADLEQLREDARRAEKNHRAGIVSDAELQRARSLLAGSESAVEASQRRVDQARANLDAARDSLAKTTIVSPMDGIVTAKRVEEGEVAVIGVQNSPGTVLLTISDMSVVETEMEVDETSIPTVHMGQEAKIRIDAYPNRTFSGIVTEVGSSPILRMGGQTTEATKFKVKIQIKDPPAGIKPGLSVQADILTGFRAQALAVPIQALVVRAAERKAEAPAEASRDEEGVYLIEGGKAKFQPIKTGLMGELSVEILEGLSGGENLITGPFKALRTLKPDDAVRIEEPSEERPADEAG